MIAPGGGAPHVTVAEIRGRLDRARVAADERGLSGLLVWARMGTDMYWYGDVTYLSGYHSPLGDFQDNPGWFGRGYSVIVLPVEGEPTLVVDLTGWEPDAVAIDDVRFTLDVPRGVADVLAERGLAGAPLGLVGRQTLLASARDAIDERLGHRLALTPADEILERLRLVKSPAELALMRNAAAVGCEAMASMMEMIRPGLTEAQIVSEGVRSMVAAGGFPYDVAVTSGARSHLYWNPAGPPHWDADRPVAKGDLIHVDLWGPVRGYYTDLARSTVVGGDPTDEQLEVLEAPLAAVPHIVEGIRPGLTVGELFARGERWMKDNGWIPEGISLAEAPPDAGPLFEHCPIFGHGIGLSNEKPWIVADDPTVLEPGMVLAIEFIVARGTDGSYLEHDVVVTETGAEVLTALCPERWW
jgi:Xaa-Pro aminopeptidase